MQSNKEWEELSRLRTCGQMAQDLDRNQYWQGLLVRLDLAYQQEILALSPDQQDQFRDLQCARQALESIKMSVEHDMMQGEKAAAILDGKEEEQGVML